MMISVVSPVYKARACMLPLYERLTQVLSAIPEFTDYEIILVEDCGHDGSWEIIEELARHDSRVRAVQLSRNFGQHHSITAGLDLCKGDWAVVMDCDLQDPPEDILRLWKKAQEGYDVVGGRRSDRQDSRRKILSSAVFHYFFEMLSGLSYDSQLTNFRIVSRKVVDAYRAMRESSRSFGVQIHWLGFETAYIDMKHSARLEGKSSYTFRKLAALALEMIISYSKKPLQISVGIGLVIFLISLCVSAYILIRKIFWAIPIDGWTSLMISVWFLGGMIVANMGVVGLYIGKIYDETRLRPIYVISHRLNC